MPRTVTIDARWLVGGIGTYIRNLLHGLRELGNGLQVHAIVRSGDKAGVQGLCARSTIVDVPIYTAREQLLIPRAAHGCELLHIPHFNAPLFHRGPLVVTIMDVIHLSSPAYRNRLSSHIYAKPMLKAAARKAEQIVTVSEYSKSQIVEVLGIPESKVSVIHCGLSEGFRADYGPEECADALKALGVRAPYLLYVGNLKPHKNVPTLLRAFAQLRDAGKRRYALLIVGDDRQWRRSVEEECRRLGITDATTIIPYVEQSLMPKIYAAADVVVMPSAVEGFGAPVLEAMASGTPVVASCVASLPEVGGDAVLYFDPHSPEELAAQITQVLESSELRTTMRDKGIQRAKQFSLQQFARAHVELYNQLLGVN
jgi:glycosyltransferase involved in cell wall biosynthesis